MNMTAELLPLPEPGAYASGGYALPFYTADQMEAYALANLSARPGVGEAVAWQYWSHGGWSSIGPDDVAKAKRLIGDGMMDPGHLRALYTQPPANPQGVDDAMVKIACDAYDKAGDNFTDPAEYPSMYAALTAALAHKAGR